MPQLRLRRHFRFDSEEVGAVLDRNPDASFWIPDTDELILVGNWRNRPDLHAIQALAATTGESALIQRARNRARQSHVKALLMVDANELRRPVFFAKHGFRVIDRIATFELDEAATIARPRHVPVSDLVFARVRSSDREGITEVERLDHLAFPWFWWNVREELHAYLALPGVEVWAGSRQGEVVSYIGITHYGSWGHLDRIATHPARQRSGIGTASLELAIDLLRKRGATRIALSTQGENAPAQRLYERRGFVRTPVHDYIVHGIVLDEAVNVALSIPAQETTPRHRQAIERKS